MKFRTMICVVIIGMALVAPSMGYIIPGMKKRQVDMRGISLYGIDSYLMAQQEAQRQHYINPKPNYVTEFYPVYDFGRR